MNIILGVSCRQKLVNSNKRTWHGSMHCAATAHMT